MDNFDLLKFVNKIPHLKSKYMGSFPPDSMYTSLPNNTFQIVNTQMGFGEHWVVFINKNGVHFFGDSNGWHIDDYFHFNDKYKHKLVHITHDPVQQTDDVCGPYCVYFAHLAFQNQLKPKNLHEFFMLRFANKYMYL